MILSVGFLRETIIEAKNVIQITPEIIECDCPECGGSGEWPYLPDELATTAVCINCKGTGRINA
jgi:DnaJ-class molecular chaperone